MICSHKSGWGESAVNSCNKISVGFHENRSSIRVGLPLPFPPAQSCHHSPLVARSLEEVCGGRWGCSVISMLKAQLSFSLKQASTALQLSHRLVDKLADETTCRGSQRTAFKSTWVRQGAALLAQASGTEVWAGVGSSYWDSPFALVKLFCSLSPWFPDTRQVLLSSGANLEVKLFSLLWCLSSVLYMSPASLL